MNMVSNVFELKLRSLHWIQHVDDPADLCAHGQMYVKIGNEVLVDETGLSVTVSAAALHLMRTIKEHYNIGDYAGQLLPCCGHVMIADENEDLVHICGCPNGIDWTIVHAGETVRHITGSGQEACIGRDAYRKIVIDFADQVEQFYNTSRPKTLPEEDLDKKGYLAFWKEWWSLRATSY